MLQELIQIPENLYRTYIGFYCYLDLYKASEDKDRLNTTMTYMGIANPLLMNYREPRRRKASQMLLDLYGFLRERNLGNTNVR